ncbi:MAG: FecR domain-containing protein, partial [Treponema sp.]|nr:FecR domain-containing protein [Treponema sp.]
MIKKESRFTKIDYLIIIFCFVGACISGAAFWGEYNNTLVNLNEEPVGTIIFQRRVAQRRFADRHVWDRLRLASPIYNGDTIRTVDQSTAIIIFGDEVTHLSLNENTIIQIFFDNRSGDAQVDFIEGNIEVTSEIGNLIITSGAYIIELDGQASMEKNEEGFVFHVSEGQASFDGVELEAGDVIAMNPYGEINTSPLITMTSFGSFASFLSPLGEAASVAFSWNSFFFNPDTYVIVEVAADRGFSRIVETREIGAVNGGGASSVYISLEHGNYWWRAFPAAAGSRTPINRFSPSGTLEVVPAAPPLLLSPPHA